MNEILDASAIIAYTKNEAGGVLVASLLADPNARCYAHVFNLCEVYYHFVRTANHAIARQVLADLRRDGIHFRRDLAVKFWQEAGDLKARGGISLPDYFCIVLAQKLGGEVVTADHHEFDPLVRLGLCPIRFIR